MGAYTDFAKVYDQFMDNIPYEEWCGYLAGLLKKYGVSSGLVLDLGCGTGNVTQCLARLGYDMIGVDSSSQMLQEALEKKEKAGLDILYLMQDMRELELYGTVAAAVSICDSMNYLTNYSDLLRVLKLVDNYLDPGGVFIFDLNTVYKYETVLGSATIAEDREDCSFIWENYYDRESMVNEYDLALFVREEGNIYRKFAETHYQRAYSIEQVRRAVLEAGMEFVACYGAFSEEPPGEDCERIYIIAREKRKTGRENDE